MNTKLRLQGAVSQHRANSSVKMLRLRARDKMQLAPVRSASLCLSALLGEMGTGLQRLAAPLHREPGLTLNAVPPHTHRWAASEPAEEGAGVTRAWLNNGLAFPAKAVLVGLCSQKPLGSERDML